MSINLGSLVINWIRSKIWIANPSPPRKKTNDQISEADATVKGLHERLAISIAEEKRLSRELCESEKAVTSKNELLAEAEEAATAMRGRLSKAEEEGEMTARRAAEAEARASNLSGGSLGCVLYIYIYIICYNYYCYYY